MSNRIGEINYNNFGSKMVIKEYRNCDDIDIYFPEYDHVVKHKGYGAFKKGSILSVYEPRHVGVGYIGEGKHKPTINGKATKVYDTWMNRLSDCYNIKNINKKPRYKDCEVCKEWHNFQVFADWWEENFYEIDGEQMELDKDILIKNNKIYSPNTCVIVPHRINSLFVKSNSKRGILPIGVIKHKEKYVSQIQMSNQGSHKCLHLGTFNTPHEAFLMYKINKELLIQGVANEYKTKIPSKLYNALMNYKVEEND